MATQTIEFECPSGMTLTAKLFTPGSDTVVDAAAATENTNDKGTYRAAFTDVAAGTYRLTILDGSSVAIAKGKVTLTLTTATFFPLADGDLIDGAISAGKIGSDALTADKFAADVSAEIAAGVETALVNDADATAVLQAIADKIASDWVAADVSVQAVASAVRDAILDRVLSGNHDTAGTPGKILQDLNADSASAAEIADAVCDEALSGHATSGTVGKALTDAAAYAESAASGVLQSTTIAALTSQTVFTLTLGSADDDAYNDCELVFVDQTTNEQKAVAYIADYVGATKTVKLLAAPIFTVAVGDKVHIRPGNAKVKCEVFAGVTNSDGDAVNVSVRLTRDGSPISIAGATCSVEFREQSGAALLWGAALDETTDPLASPVIYRDAFRLTKALPGFTDDTIVLVEATVTLNGRAFVGFDEMLILGA